MIDTPPVDAIIFDLGNVLIDINWDQVIKAAAPYTPLAEDSILPLVHSSVTLDAYEKGRIDSDTFCSEIVSLLQLDMDNSRFVELWTSIFTRRERMEEFFQRMLGITSVAILSDTSELHWEYISKQVPLFATANALILSYQKELRKPDPAIYEAAARDLRVPIGQCIFVDDLQKNVDGAHRAGMQAFQFSSIEETVERLSSLFT